MRLLWSPLRTFLWAETPVLIVAIALLSWGVHVVSDAQDYVNRRGPWRQASSTLTYTTTSTGQVPIYTPSTIATRRFTSAPGGGATSYVPTTYTLSYPATSVFGTTTATVTSVARSYVDPPAAYTRALSETSTNDGTDNDMSWGEGFSNSSARNGLYSSYSDATSDLYILNAMMGTSLAAFALRLAATVASTVVELMQRNHEGKTTQRTAMALAATILAVACASFLLSVICGCIGWYWLFYTQQPDAASDIQATIAFWALATLTTLVVVGLAAVSVYKHRRRNVHKASTNGSMEKL